MRRTLVIIALVVLFAAALALRSWLLREDGVAALAPEPAATAGHDEPPQQRAVATPSSPVAELVDRGATSFPVEVEVFDGTAHAAGFAVKVSGEAGVMVQTTNAMGFTCFELAPGTWVVEEPAVSPRRTLEVLGPMTVRLDVAHLARVSGRVAGRSGQSAEVQVSEVGSARVVKAEHGAFSLTTSQAEVELRAHSGSLWSAPVKVKTPAEGVDLVLAPTGVLRVVTRPQVDGVLTVVHDGVTALEVPFASGGQVNVPLGSLELTVKAGEGASALRGEAGAVVRGQKPVTVEVVLEPVTP